MNSSVIKASFSVSKHWTFIFSGACLTMRLINEMKLVGDCVLQAPEMFRHGFQSQVCVRGSIAQSGNIFKRCNYSLYLLIILFVAPVNLTMIKMVRKLQNG